MSDNAEVQKINLYQQRFKLYAWIRSRLWAQVLAAMVAGLAVGVALGPDSGILDQAAAENIGAWLALPGHIFLNLIAMMLVPLIFASIVGGLAGIRAGSNLGATGLKLGCFILGTTVAASWIGAGLALWLRPGRGVAFPAAVPTSRLSSEATAAGAAAFDGAKAPDIIAGVLPSNPTASIVQGDMLAIVVLAILVGIAATQVDRTKVAPFLALLDAVLSIAMTIVKWAMFLAPFAVFGLMAQLVMRVGMETILGVSSYVGSVLFGLTLLLVLYLTMVAIVAGIGPVRFLKIAGGTLLLAFSTSSSSAIMPMTIQTARRLGVPEPVANLVVPLGATMNMAGTALYQTMAILFLAQIAGVTLDLPQIAVITATLVASSIGAPGTPGVSIAILVSVAAGFGIPTEGMVIVLGVDRLLDMSRTSVNVTGDLVAGVLLRGRQGAAAEAASRQPDATGVP